MDEQHRTVAVLGEMAELGQDAVEGHRAVGREAGELGVDLVLAVGGALAERPALAAGAAGVETVAIARDNDTAAAWLQREVRPGDVVLVKGSRSGKLWQVAETLAGQQVTAWGDWNRTKEETTA